MALVELTPAKMFLVALASMTGLGGGLAFLLSLAHRKLKTEEDPKIAPVEAALPGINCGACGEASCRTFAEAVVAGRQAVNGCRAGGLATARRVAAVMGVKVEGAVIQKAVVHCGADDSVRRRRGHYTGIRSCTAANLHLGGNIVCRYGCLGYGDCSRSCPFDAIEMVDGLPAIRFDRCVACGKCVAACPRHIITLQTLKNDTNYAVRCSNPEVGRAVRRVCSVGCIACGRCQKDCPVDAIHVVENLARFDYEKCTAVGACAKACPTKCITVIGGRIPQMTAPLEAAV
jgi:Na+-translocating ferredoxin:NAD+ oxidoreductase RNF subunit RnfB